MTEFERDLTGEAIVGGFDDGVFHAATDQRALIDHHASAQHGGNHAFFSGRNCGLAGWMIVVTSSDDGSREQCAQRGRKRDAATADHTPERRRAALNRSHDEAPSGTRSCYHVAVSNVPARDGGVTSSPAYVVQLPHLIAGSPPRKSNAVGGGALTVSFSPAEGRRLGAWRRAAELARRLPDGPRTGRAAVPGVAGAAPDVPECVPRHPGWPASHAVPRRPPAGRAA